MVDHKKVGFLTVYRRICSHKFLSNVAFIHKSIRISFIKSSSAQYLPLVHTFCLDILFYLKKEKKKKKTFTIFKSIFKTNFFSKKSF